jgi:hypothetical protein
MKRTAESLLALIAVAALTAGCKFPFPLDGLPCPCASGYTCDETYQVCMHNGRPDSGGGVDSGGGRSDGGGGGGSDGGVGSDGGGGGGSDGGVGSDGGGDGGSDGGVGSDGGGGGGLDGGVGSDGGGCTGGSCQCTVATEATDCGPHEFCDASGGVQQCACVAGYTNPGGGCVWTGAVQDPGISGATAWTVVHGALLNPTAFGGIDPGEADFLPFTLCTQGHIRQTFDMPTFAKAQPLVLELSYKSAMQMGGQFGLGYAMMGVSWDRGWVPLPYFFDAKFHTTRLCLGESAFAPVGTTGRGHPVTLSLGPYDDAIDCPNTVVTNFAIDHAQVIAANPGECGTQFGQGVNPGAEGTGGWTFSSSDPGNGFIDGIGVGGSRAARAYSTCGHQVSMKYPIDVVARNPALEMYVATTGGAASTIAGAWVGFGRFPIDVPPVGQSAALHMCLPPSLAGQSTDLVLQVLANAITACEVLPDSSIVADEVRVVEDPACQPNDAAGNPGFERPGAMFGAATGNVVNGSAVVIRDAPGVAHSGAGYLSIESYARCSVSEVVLAPIVPAPTATAGPALTFYSNVGGSPDASTNAGSSVAFVELAKGGGWIKNTLCLDPAFAGRPTLVGFSQYGGNGGPGQGCDSIGYGVQAALIDDLEVTTAPSCPVK